MTRLIKVPRFCYFIFFIAVFSFGCEQIILFPSDKDTENQIGKSKYKTDKVVIVVIDGPRYSESWGDPTHKHVPYMANFLAKQGVVNTNFYNLGRTYTNAGHSAITTGNYQAISNDGKELPYNPSIFQYFLKASQKSEMKAWVIASKDKLAVLADCENPNFKNKYNASTDCGNDGLGTGYRPDSTTFMQLVKIFKIQRPNLVVINFRAPDYWGHRDKWDAYLGGIRSTDRYVYEIWKLLQNDPYYHNSTTMFVTNDHGRHLNNVRDGFISHGDFCEGCKHINFFACGPDFKEGVVCDSLREQIDITATVAELLQFEMPTSKGKIMKELFSDPKAIP